MKKLQILSLLLCVLLVLASCGGKDGGDDSSAPSAATPYGILSKVITAAGELEARDDAEYLEDGLIYRGDSTTEGEYLTDGQKSLYYGTLTDDADFSGVTDYALWTATGPVATELGIFKVKDEAAVEVVKAFMGERVNTLRLNAKDYKPEEELKAENALITSKGLYVIYLVTNVNSELDGVIDEAIIAELIKN